MIGIKTTYKSCTLLECPVGLFMSMDNDTLCLKTEYGLDAYIVSTGEAFCGGATTKEELAKVRVVPCKLIY